VIVRPSVLHQLVDLGRQRQTLDEDAPPTASVNDIVAANLTDTPSSVDILRKRRVCPTCMLSLTFVQPEYPGFDT